MITAVDVGASKTLVAQFDNTGKLLSSIRFETPQNQDEFYDELASNLKKLGPLEIVCIGVPGIVDSLGVIRRCGRLSWVDFDLKGMLQKDFGTNILIENDAKLAGLGEANALNPMPETCLYITVSTGIGDGVVQNGKLVKALRYSEAGHMTFFIEDKWQTWQDVASGKAIRQHFGKMAKDIVDPTDWQWAVERLAMGLCALIPTIQPDVIVIGGSVGSYFDRYGNMLAELLNKRLPAFIKKPQLVGAKHPEEAVIYGCYHYATHHQDI